MSNLTNDQLITLKETFDLLDQDGDGQITAQDLGEFMRSVGLSPSEAELHQMVGEVDSDGNGTINMGEFLSMMTRKMVDDDAEVEIREALAAISPEDDGQISEEELRRVMTELGDPLTEAEVDELIAAVVVDGHNLFGEQPD